MGEQAAPEAYVLSLLAEGRHQAAFEVIPEFGSPAVYAPGFADLGHRLWRSGDAGQAEEVLRKGLELDPERASTWLTLACVLLSQDKTAEGEGCLLEAIRCSPSAAAAHHLRGVLARASGRTQEAAEHFATCLEADPAHKEAACELGQLIPALPCDDGARARGEEALARAAERAPARPAPALSACLIARDEAGSLPRCLQSLQMAAGQIVVMDTGSRDHTEEIARRFGAEVHRFDWSDDFAAARNAALSHATGDWILVMDSDEELPPESADQLKELLAHGAPGPVCQLITHTPSVPSGRGAADLVGHLRLFRNGRGIHFEGAIHEQLVDREGEPITSAVATGITVLHHGYLESPAAMAERGERNMRLLAARAEAEPDNPYVLFHLGNAHLGCGELEEAARVLRRAFELAGPAHAFRTKAAVLAAEVLALVSDPSGAEKVVRSALRSEPEHPELLCALGRALEHQGRTEEAITAYEAATRGRFGASTDYHDFACRDASPRARLGAIHLARGHAEEALRAVDPGLAIRPEACELRHLRAAALVSLGRGAEAQDELERLLSQQPDDVLARNTLGVVLALEGDHAAAARQFEVAHALSSDDVDILCNLGAAQQELGDATGARERFEAAVERSPTHVPAWLGLARAYLSQSAYQASAKCLEMAAKHSGYSPEVMAQVAVARATLASLLATRRAEETP